MNECEENRIGRVCRVVSSRVVVSQLCLVFAIRGTCSEIEVDIKQGLLHTTAVVVAGAAAHDCVVAFVPDCCPLP